MKTITLRRNVLAVGIGFIVVCMLLSNQFISSSEFGHIQLQNITIDPKILTTATKIAKEGKPVAISVINDAYLPFAHSWLCNTQFMDVHEQVMLIVTDVTSRKELEEKWPKIHVMDVKNLGHGSAVLNFSTAGYIRLMTYRTNLIYKLLMNNVDVFLFEVDAVWFQNLVYDIKNRIRYKDIAVVLVTSKNDTFAGGLLYMKATNRTKNIWAELTIKMNQLGEKVKGKPDYYNMMGVKNDQDYLSSLLMRKVGHIQVAKLPGDVYADGKWYTDKQKNYNPILINNNWVVGRDAKIARAIQFKHWFWNMASHTCDVDLVRKTCKIPGNTIQLGFN